VTLARLLADTAARAPDRPALLTGGSATTYAELDALTARAAGSLLERGVATGDRVALVLPNTPGSVAAFHGALRIGAVPVPLNPLLSRNEVEERVSESGAQAVEAAELAGGEPAEPVSVAPDDVAVVLYTSGTTGRPKRAELTHGGLRLSAEATADACPRSASRMSAAPHCPARHALRSSAASAPACSRVSG
jgi:long-chain acyl-CoA synthetase